MENVSLLDHVIYGRVDPHIYAFETCTVPNYLKVGDTYRPVEVRLDEWRRVYENLIKRYDHEAKVDSDTYFRDYSVHSFLKGHGFQQIDPDCEEFKDIPYLSMEFFHNVKEENIDEAIADIKKSFNDNDGRYDFYRIDDIKKKGEENIHYERNEKWTPRRNQQDVIDNFWHAYHDLHRTKLLMYAVMRFGKSFTALCCAKKMEAKLVVVVCGKTDVRDEWQRNVEKPTCFEGYYFRTADDMKNRPGCVSEILAGGKRVVVFLTLQDLLGTDVKTKHKDLFDLNSAGKLDMLIVDETHFAARSEKTGAVLAENKEEKRYVGDNDSDKDENIDSIKEFTKQFRPKVALHLSGTPYRILLDGEFEEQDIIASVQYSDIVGEKEAWDKEHLDETSGKENINEWENPYFGFPQMIRFAFNLNRSSLDKLRELKEKGVPFLLNHLLEPCETSNKEGHDQFKNEKEVLELLEAIDGCKTDDNILGFLDNERIRKGQLCHHIVMVLPFKASCDAMKKLIESNHFSHLSDYNILNISGFNAPHKYTTGDYVKRIKEDIENFEKDNKKTITLTVGRMLTGSTVKEWDTMIFLRDTSSPQVYDQAVFRLQSQFVKTSKKDKNGDVIKYDMKPQTLLVDFDPTRMFKLENEKSLIANANKDVRGNELLEEKLDKELRVSPIIAVNAGKLREVKAANILDEVRRYSENRSILDETFDIDIDKTLLVDDNIKEELEKQPEMDVSGSVFTAKPIVTDGDGDSTKIPDSTENGDKEHKEKTQTTIEDDEMKSLGKRLRTIYFKLMLFVYLSPLHEDNLNDVLDHMENDADCRRIRENLDIDISIVRLIQRRLNWRIINELENKLHNSNDLGDTSGNAVKKALRRFAKISKSEIVTPENIADEMIARLPDDITANSKFLDIAAKEGEFANAIVKRYGDGVKNNVYSIPTSGVTYECTRKIYTLLGMPVEHIYTFTSFEMIDKNKKENIMTELKDMKFNVLVGNPPYNEIKATDKSTSNKAFATALYPLFIDASMEIKAKYDTLITPSRWMTKQGQGISEEWVDKMLNGNHYMYITDFPKAKDCFPNAVEIKGGVNYFLLSPEYAGKCTFIVRDKEKEISAREDYLNSIKAGIIIRDGDAESIIKKIMLKEGEEYFNSKSFSSLVSPKHYFDRGEQLSSNWKGYSKVKNTKHPIKYYLNKNLEKKGYGWINKKDIPKGVDTIDMNKIYIPMAGGTGNDSQILGKPFYGEPQSVCSYTYLVIGYSHNLTKLQCKYIISYIKTRFFRYMVSIKKKTQNTTRELFQFVPLQDFTSGSDIDWTESIDDIDRQLYRKYALDDKEIDFIERMIAPMK